MLGRLLFLIYVNDLHRASAYINPIMLADDTNLFCSSKDIKTLFETINFELIKISEWLKIKKLFINMDKTDFILFHSRRANENLLLKLPLLFHDGFEIKQIP